MNGGVSISLRRLTKYKEEGLTADKLLDKILQKRDYLSCERQEIALKLKDYLSNE